MHNVNCGANIYLYVYIYIYICINPYNPNIYRCVCVGVGVGGGGGGWGGVRGVGGVGVMVIWGEGRLDCGLKPMYFTGMEYGDYNMHQVLRDTMYK